MQEIRLTSQAWQDFLAGLYERDDRLELRQSGETYPRDETVDAYVFSGHAEALQSAEIDGDLWGTLEDIDETATSDTEAWQKIRAFYAGRDCVLIKITDASESEEWIITERLAQRLRLLDGTS